MSNHRSAGSFCSLVVSTVLGTSDSVQSLLLATYGDGAEVYCVANLATYRMDGAVVGQPTVGDSLVQPASGFGIWVKQGASADLAQGTLGTGLHSASLGALSAGVWAALPSGATFYSASPSSNFWSLNTTTGILTYIGPNNVMFLMNTTFGVFYNVVTPQTICIDVAVNGALIGGTTTPDTSSNVTTQGIIQATTLLTHNVLIRAASNATYQTVFRDLSTPSGTFTVDKYQMMLTAQS